MGLSPATADRRGWQLDDQHARAVPTLTSPWQPRPVDEAALLVLNEPLAVELGLDPEWLRRPEQVAVLAGAAIPEGANPVAQGYAGHQFGRFAGVLGDGRAVLLGEVTDSSGRIVDLALKGSGRTAFSRGGDGNATLGSVLRELLVSEGMHALGIATSRTLAVSATGGMVHRQRPEPGAVLARVASSHLRIGTMELAARVNDPQLLSALVELAISRHHRLAADADSPALALLEAVVAAQAELIASWMAVGFIHGVMNTDNMTISGETIDYGPCAFVEAEDPNAVFSSIDSHGRYRFGQQPAIAVWNLSRLAEALLPLIAADFGAAEAVARATEAVEGFVPAFSAAHLDLHRAKLGLPSDGGGDDEDARLVADYSALLAAHRVDHTLGWRRLSDSLRGLAGAAALFGDDADFGRWQQRWLDRLGAVNRAAVADDLDAVNPLRIPRNHLVEDALTAALAGDLAPTADLLAAVRNPFGAAPFDDRFAQPASDSFTQNYVTYCGT